MSSAFVKEPEGGEAFEDLPDRPISPHPNFVTLEGFSRIEAELERLHREHAAAQEADDKASLARTARDLRYWTARRNTAQVVTAPADAAEAHFGSTVTIEREDGRRQTFRIVGEDEADPRQGHDLLRLAGRPGPHRQARRRRRAGRRLRGRDRRDRVAPR